MYSLNLGKRWLQRVSITLNCKFKFNVDFKQIVFFRRNNSLPVHNFVFAAAVVAIVVAVVVGIVLATTAAAAVGWMQTRPVLLQHAKKKNN